MAAHSRRELNREAYERLGERWYAAKDDLAALLRAEARGTSPWISAEIEQSFLGPPCRVLDVGCGAGFLANDLARRGHNVVGLDASAQALDVARRHDATRSVRWVESPALPLPFDGASFDAVCAMDFLEHVPDPAAVVGEAARVLVPGGLFFFHTFDRSLLSWLVVIKALEWFVPKTPRDLHRLSLFIRPGELRAMCDAHGLGVEVLRGFRPRVATTAFARLLWTGQVGDDLEFGFNASPRLGYLGYARKEG